MRQAGASLSGVFMCFLCYFVSSQGTFFSLCFRFLCVNKPAWQLSCFVKGVMSWWLPWVKFDQLMRQCWAVKIHVVWLCSEKKTKVEPKPDTIMSSSRLLVSVLT